MTRPRVTLKLATSLDGRIATASGESKWITGEAAREQAHRLRAEHDAVLVGVETVIADDPELSIRLPDYDGPQPIRIVLDSYGRMPLRSRLADPELPVLIYSVEPSGTMLAAEVEQIIVPDLDGRVDILSVMEDLEILHEEMRAEDPFLIDHLRLMVEGGGQVAASFLQADLVDAIEWFRAPIVLGGDGRPGIAGMGLDVLATAPRFTRVAVHELGPDLWERYERA